MEGIRVKGMMESVALVRALHFGTTNVMFHLDNPLWIG